MGNRRLGAQRLNALMKKGSDGTDTSYQAGAGIKNAIVSHKMFKQGGVIETQILVDLQGKAGIEIWSKDDDEYIGEATADGTNAVLDVSLMQWENDVHGVLYEAEILCLEVPTAGADDLQFSFDTYVAAHAQSTAVAGTALLLADGAAAFVLGDRHMIPVMDEDLDNASPEVTAVPAVTDVDTKGLYISNGETLTAAAFTAGKFLITLRGYDNQWGF
jgi:hypothetical protein